MIAEMIAGLVYGAFATAFALPALLSVFWFVDIPYRRRERERKRVAFEARHAAWKAKQPSFDLEPMRDD